MSATVGRQLDRLVFELFADVLKAFPSEADCPNAPHDHSDCRLPGEGMPLFRWNVGRQRFAEPFETPLTQQIKSDPQWYSAYADKTALKRWATPDEIVGAVLFLASDASTYVTGTLRAPKGG